MGWDGFRATNYTKRGRVNRKAECDALHTWSDDNGRTCCVLKSRMVGSVYYAAIQITSESMGRKVIGCVDLTRENSKEYDNFMVKSMSEDMHPFFYDCPESILNLLTDTTSESASEWRAKCREAAKAKKERPNISKLPIGTTIEFNYNNRTRRFYKSAPRFQFKTPFWTDGYVYIQKKNIPRDFRVVESVS